MPYLKTFVAAAAAALLAAAPALADVAMEAQTVQLAATPMGLPPGKDAWTFRLPQGNDVMAHAVVALMKKQGVKTIGFLGYTDAYGVMNWTPTDPWGYTLETGVMVVVKNGEFALANQAEEPCTSGLPQRLACDSGQIVPYDRPTGRSNN